MSVAQKSSKIKTPPSNMHSRVHWWAVICEWKILLSVLFCFWYFSFHWELSFYTICIFLNIKSFWILPQMNPIEQNFHRGSVQLAKKRGGTVLHLGTSHPWVIVQGGSLKFLGVEALFYDIFRIIATNEPGFNWMRRYSIVAGFETKHIIRFSSANEMLFLMCTGWKLDVFEILMRVGRFVACLGSYHCLPDKQRDDW